jgi:hypothetical protein
MQINVKRILIGLTTLCLFLWLLNHFRMTEATKFYEVKIPEKLEIAKLLYVKEDGAFRVDNVAVVFRLSDTAIKRINAEGLRFFEGATRPRSGAEWSYQNWKSTPVPNSWTSEGTWFLFYDHLLIEISQKAQIPGSYYTNYSDFHLVVIPSLNLIAYSNR